MEQENQPSDMDVMEAEEQKLRSKYPDLGRKPANSILQKRLNKNVKYFDSGDYNMAKAKVKLEQPQAPSPPEHILMDSTGETIATPETVPAVRKKSLMMNPEQLAGFQISPSSPPPIPLSTSPLTFSEVLSEGDTSGQTSSTTHDGVGDSMN